MEAATEFTAAMAALRVAERAYADAESNLIAARRRYHRALRKYKDWHFTPDTQSAVRDGVEGE